MPARRTTVARRATTAATTTAQQDATTKRTGRGRRKPAATPVVEEPTILSQPDVSDSEGESDDEISFSNRLNVYHGGGGDGEEQNQAERGRRSSRSSDASSDSSDPLGDDSAASASTDRIPILSPIASFFWNAGTALHDMALGGKYLSFGARLFRVALVFGLVAMLFSFSFTVLEEHRAAPNSSYVQVSSSVMKSALQSARTRVDSHLPSVSLPAMPSFSLESVRTHANQLFQSATELFSFSDNVEKLRQGAQAREEQRKEFFTVTVASRLAAGAEAAAEARTTFLHWMRSWFIFNINLKSLIPSFASQNGTVSGIVSGSSSSSSSNQAAGSYFALPAFLSSFLTAVDQRAESAALTSHQMFYELVDFSVFVLKFPAQVTYRLIQVSSNFSARLSFLLSSVMRPFSSLTHSLNDFLWTAINVVTKPIRVVYTVAVKLYSADLDSLTGGTTVPTTTTTTTTTTTDSSSSPSAQGGMTAKERKHVRHLQEELHKLGERVELAESQLGSTTAATTGATGQLRSMQPVLKELKERLQRAESLLSSTESTAAGAVSTIGTVQGAVQGLETRLQQAETQLQTVDATGTAAKGLAEAAGDRLEQLQSRVQKTETGLVSAGESATRLQTRVDAVAGSVKELQHGQQQLTEQLEATSSVATAAQQQAGAAASEVNAVREQLAESDSARAADTAKLNKMVKELQSQLKSLQQQLEETKEAMLAAAATAASQTTKSDADTQTPPVAAAPVVKLDTAAVDRLSSRVDQWVEESEQASAGLKQQISSVLERQQQLADLLDSNGKEDEELRAVIVSLSSSVHSINEQLVSLSSTDEQLQSQDQSLLDDFHQLEAQLKKVQSQLKKQAADIDAAASAAANAATGTPATGTTVDSAELELVKEDVQQLHDTVGGTSSNIDLLKEELRQIVTQMAVLKESLEKDDTAVDQVVVQLITNRIKEEMNLVREQQQQWLEQQAQQKYEELAAKISAQLSTIAAAPAYGNVEVPSDFERVIDEKIRLYDADRGVGMVDWALGQVGGYILHGRTSSTYKDQASAWGRLWTRGHGGSLPPEALLNPDMTPGSCWAMQGRSGSVTVGLEYAVQVTHITLDHVSARIAPRIHTAPRHFRVWGYTNQDPSAEGDLLLDRTEFSINANSNPVLTVPIPQPTGRAYTVVRLEILDNYGDDEFTCIYRFRVHGQAVPISQQ